MKRMTTQKSRERKLRPAESAMLADGFLRVPRTGRVKAASASKQQTQADLIDPDARPQNPAQDLPIQEPEKVSQTSVPRPGGTEPRPPCNSPRGWPFLLRGLRRPTAPRRVPFSGRPPSSPSSRRLLKPPPPPSFRQP